MIFGEMWFILYSLSAVLRFVNADVQHYMTHPEQTASEFGSQFLPLRSAIEALPAGFNSDEERIPIRDSVEKIPSHASQRKGQDRLSSSHLEHLTQRKPAGTNQYRVVCYYGIWNKYRKSEEAHLLPENIRPELCTHIVYAFAALNAENYSITPSDSSLDIESGYYSKITSSVNGTNTRVLIAMGGWTDSAGSKYSNLVSSGQNRRKFVNSLISFLRRHQFHGLHLDWTYPVCWQAKCSEENKSDRHNFLKLVQEIKSEFDKREPSYELAVAISGYKEIIDVAYDVLGLNDVVDFMSVLTYDYHGPWETRTDFISPLYKRRDDSRNNYNVDSALSHLVLLGAEPNKLVMGVPFYGQSYTLSSENENGVGAMVAEPGLPGKLTQQPGILAYYEICEKVNSDSWIVGRNPDAGSEVYAYKGNQWVSYEDQISLTSKVNYVKKQKYGGVMTWTIDLDDFNNACCEGAFPLLQHINYKLGRISKPIRQCGKPEHSSPSTISTSTTTDYETVTDLPSSSEETTTTFSTSSASTSTSVASTPQRPWWPPSLTPRPTKRPTTPHSTKYPPTSFTTTAIPITSSLPPSHPDGCDEGATKANRKDCISYYRCVHNRWTNEECAFGLHWNDKSHGCDWPSVAACSSQNDVAEGGYVSTSPPILEVDNEVEYIDPAQVPPSPQWIQPAKSECVHGQYYSAVESCDKFYACYAGQLQLQQCPATLYWDAQNLRCDWSYNVKCQKGHKHHTQRFQVIKESCTSGQFAANPSDCGKYYECQWGVYREAACASGLHWNERLQTCDWPHNAGCATSNIPEITDNSIDGPTSTFATSTSSSTSRPTIRPSTNKKPPSSASTPWWSWTTGSTTTNEWTWSPEPSTTANPWEWTPSISTATLPTPKPSYPLPDRYKVVCYFTNWAWYRPGRGKHFPEDVDPNLCSHVVYGFAVLDYESLTMKVYDSWADIDNKFYVRSAALKKRGVKVLIAIGGWNDSEGDKYSRLVNNPSARRRFITSSIRFIQKYGFQGLDLDWEYPKCWQVNCDRGPSSDKEGFAALVSELREAFNEHGYLLSAAVSPSKTVIDQAYDVPSLSRNLDWISVMTYDYHGQWDKKTGHVAPIYYIPEDDFDYFNINYTMHYWMKRGASPTKLVMGMPMYGQGFTLADTSRHDLNAPSYGPSTAGEYTRASGFLAYYEICDKVRREGWTVVEDPVGRRGPYAHKGNQWVGYDNKKSIAQKVEMIKDLGLGGGMIWALDLDDFRNICGEGYYPLLNTIVRGLASSQHDANKPSTDTLPSSESDYTTSFPSPSTITTSRRPSSTKKPASKPTRKPTTEMPSTTESTTTYKTSTTSETTSTSTDNENNFKVVCYFTNWAWYRQGIGRYLPSDIDSQLCTHIIYGFAVLDSNTLKIKPHDSWADIENNFYSKVTALKKHGLKVLLAIGGWNDSAGNKYSRLVNSVSARRAFVSHVVNFLKKYDFDGLDVDWEYPKCWQVDCSKGPASDKEGFSAFISELKEAFTPHDFLLSAAVSPNRKVIDEGYDVDVLSSKLDWISVMAYDYHGQWDKHTGHVAPMYVHPEDSDRTFNTNYSIHYWVEKGADPGKLVMGMPMYGQSFSLADRSRNDLNAQAYGGGEAGESTRARGFLAYYEICDRVLRKGWEVVYDQNGRMGPYARRGDQWVSFDDQPMIRHKAEYVYHNKLGGAMIWALDLDDFRNICGCGSYPLLKTINMVLRNYKGKSEDDAFENCYLENDGRSELSALAAVGEADGWTNEPCGDDASTWALRRNPADCGKYFICAYGHYLMPQSCPDRMHFNSLYETCDWQERVNCETKNSSSMDGVSSRIYYL